MSKIFAKIYVSFQESALTLYGMIVVQVTASHRVWRRLSALPWWWALWHQCWLDLCTVQQYIFQDFCFGGVMDKLGVQDFRSAKHTNTESMSGSPRRLMPKILRCVRIHH